MPANNTRRTGSKAPTDDLLRQLVNDDGWTTREIADAYGMTLEGVRYACRAAGITPPGTGSRTNHKAYIPWERIRADHAGSTIAKRLRLYSKQQQGVALNEIEERLLSEWIDYMDGDNPWKTPLSVHYDIKDDKGFWLEARQAGDEHYVHPTD